MGSVLGAIPIVSSVANPIIQHYETNRQMNFQEEQNSINRDWQTVEAEKARQFSAEQQQKAMDYNSPVYQANEFSKAGINPVLAMSGGKGVASVSGGSAAPMASPVGGVSPIQGQPIDLQIPQLMNGLGSMFKNLAEAKQLGVNTDILTRSAEYLIKNNMLTAQQKEIGNSLLAIDKYIAENVKDAKVTRTWDESKKALFDAVISSNEADRGNLINRVMESQERFNNALSKYHGKNTDLISLEVANFDKKLNAYLNLAGAQAAESRASASEKSVSAEQIKLFNKIYSDKRYQHSIISQAVTAGQQAIDQNKLTRQQVQHMNYMIEQAAYANDLKEFTYWSNQIQGYVHSIGEAASAFYGAGALRELIKLRKAGVPSAPLESGKGYYLNNDGLLFKRP